VSDNGTTFAPHRDTAEFFVECMHGGAGKDALSGILAEDVVLYGPLGDEPVTGRDAVLDAMREVGTLASDLTYKEVLSGQTHHAAYFRLQVDDTVVNGMDYILLDAEGNRRGDHMVAPAAGRRRDAGASRCSPRHGALETSHRCGVTASVDV
jgi:hypothetical protein